MRGVTTVFRLGEVGRPFAEVNSDGTLDIMDQDGCDYKRYSGEDAKELAHAILKANSREEPRCSTHGTRLEYEGNGRYFCPDCHPRL